MAGKKGKTKDFQKFITKSDTKNSVNKTEKSEIKRAK